MPYIDPNSQDAYLNDIRDNAKVLVICSSDPTTYAEAVAATLASKTNPVIAVPSSYTGGRRLVVSAITDMSGTVDGTGTHWAILDTVNERLKTTQELSESTGIVAGAVIETTAVMNINCPNAVGA